jgi:hypothetical protein
MKNIFLATIFLLASCAPATAVVTPQLVKVYVSSAASSKLPDLYDCSTPSTAIYLADPQSADLTLRLGPPDQLSLPAYQIGTDDVDVIVPSRSNLSQLTVDQVHSIFLGQVTNWKDVGGPDMPIRVWTYAQGEDIRQIFEQNAMDGQRITPSARLAVSAQNMLDSVAKDASSIGFLPHSLETTGVRSVCKVATVPLLVILKSQPGVVTKGLVACLQGQ